MKNTHFLVFILSTFLIFSGRNTATAQTNEWAPVGATWHYTIFNRYVNAPGDTINVLEDFVMRSAKDTVMDGFTYRKLVMEQHTFLGDTISYPPHFILDINDKVFYWDNGQHYLLYDFDAPLLDSSQRVYFPNPTVFPMECNKFLSAYPTWKAVYVTGYDTIEISGVSVREQFWDPYFFANDSSCVTYQLQVLEFIGSTGFFWGRSDYPNDFVTSAIDYLEKEAPIIVALNCYNDDRISFKNSIWLFDYMECGYVGYFDSIAIKVGMNSNTSTKAIKISPNPAITQLAVDIPPKLREPARELIIRNLAGQQVQSHTLTGAPRKMVDVGDLPSGLYLAEMWGSEGLLGRVKFVRQ